MKRRRGQALILVVVGIGIVLVGAMGLAIDTGQLYGQRQMAQAAADAAAQAAILTIFSGTVAATTLQTSAYTCANGTDTTTPCYYARKNGFGAATGSTDEIDVSFPSSISGVGNLSTEFSPSAVKVLISRPVSATFMGMFGKTTTTIKASATAAILTGTSPVSIAVLHPNLTNSFQLNDASTNVTITGGPQQALQINSGATSAFSANASATLNLSTAGPNATGADFGSFGGPTSAGSWLQLGSTGHFYQPSAPTQDPFRSIAAPTDPGTGHPGTIDKNSAKTFACSNDCPQAAATANKCSNAQAGNCWIYNPGHYSDMSNLGGGGAPSYLVFNPGLYWVDSGGFSLATGGNVTAIMCGKGATFGAPGGTCDAVPAWETSGCCSTNNQGMMVYLNGGNISMGGNASAALVGADNSSTFKGILFFGNRNSTNTTTHSMGGGGTLSLTGSIYLTNCRATPCTIAGSQYQAVQFSGHSGSTTTLTGEIITDQLILKGGGSIAMNLSPGSAFTVTYNYIGLVK
jgi:hypothetical protein